MSSSTNNYAIVSGRSSILVPPSSIAQHTQHTDYTDTQYINSPPSASQPSALDIELLTSIDNHHAFRRPTRIDSFMHTGGFNSQQEQQYTNYSPLGDASWAGAVSDILAESQAAPWSMYNSMGFAGVAPVNGLKRQRSHQRTPSAASVVSNGPASPYNNNVANPQIANTDFEPSYNQSFSKDPYAADPAYLSAHYIPGQASAAMKGFAFDNLSHEDLSSLGSRGTSMPEQDSPTTPGSAPEDVETKVKAVPEFRTFNPQVQLARTESAAYQDELYNPANFRSTPAPKSAKLQPPTSAHRTLVNQRLETANQARSHSPNSIASRERSPFREGSQLAPTDGWASPRGALNTAGSRRQAAKEEREEAEYAMHRPQLQREPTKTISPKDALLDYNDGEQPSLFQDTVPIGYKQHFGPGTDALTNAYLAQQNPSTFTLPPSSQTSMAGFRASSSDAFTNNFTFTAPALPTTTTMQNPYQMNNYQQVSHLTPQYNAASVDTTPDFPAHLTSMESSISEGPPMSSQESASNTLQRPADTRAATGTYTCTYHGCTQRFESPASLQRHKREFHRSQQHHRDGLSVETSSVSPRSTESPGPTSGSGLTSAQILARNSQAGPHKCTRINPSTGKPCNTIFSRPYDLTRHEDTIHNGRKQKVRCPYCREEKTFSRNDALTRHMRVVHPDVENFGKRGRRGD